MTSRSSSALLGLALCACTPTAEAPKVSEALPPPSAVQQTGKAMLTSRGYIHPEDPPGTRRSSRPHGRLIAPCSAWVPGDAITDQYGKTTQGPRAIFLSMTLREKRGQATVTASRLRASLGEPHPATKGVMIGMTAPLGAHWSWVSEANPGATLLAEVQPDGSIDYHFAEIGRMSGGNTSASMKVDCIIEDHGTPGW